MGTASVELHKSAVERIKSPAYYHVLHVCYETDMGDDLFLVYIMSPLLPAGHWGTLEMVIEPDTVRFKRWADL